ncbi:proline--tRNA ligase [Candidatus Woesearchaeota archaeon]|nr:proline--tRNA ligase [Candidatus Woesearchaeota archaeon]
MSRNHNKNNSDKRESLGITASKDEEFSEWYTQVIQKAGLADYTPVSGCIVFRPYSYAIWEKIQSFFDNKIKRSGVQNAYFPLLIPESLLNKEKEHVEGFSPEVAWVTHAGNSKLNEKLAIRPTSETIMYDSYRKWIRSYKDLPLRINQWNNVVRWEFKYAMPFMRTREFLWQEGHTAFATKEEADKEVLEILDYYAQIYEELLAIPVIKGRKTEKEKFAGADYTTSIEIFLPVGKGIQGATSHHLGQNFSKAFDISFSDKDCGKGYVWQNSWGITTRSIGILTIMHGDNKGLVLPPKIAPVQVVVVPIIFEKSKDKVIKNAQHIKKLLGKHSVILDDRTDYTSGFKFNEWELKGVPIRIEIGPKDLEKKQVILARRDTGDKKAVKILNLKKVVAETLMDIQESLFDKAKKSLDRSIVDIKDLKDFQRYASQEKMLRMKHCGNIKCEEAIKDNSGLKTLCIPFDQPEKVEGKCPHCGEPARYVVLFARSY